MTMRLKVQEILQKAKNYTARYERSVVQVEKWLAKKELSDPEKAFIVEQLLQERFVDPLRFAEAFMADKLKFAHWGMEKVRRALRYDHQISEEQIQQAWDSLQETYEYNEQKELIPLLKAKYKSLNTTDRRKQYDRLMRYALGKGFSMDTVQRTVRRLLEREAMREE